MLKLFRGEDEKILIETPDGTRIYIKVESIRSRNVCLSFVAPPEVLILRAELDR